MKFYFDVFVFWFYRLMTAAISPLLMFTASSIRSRLVGAGFLAFNATILSFLAMTIIVVIDMGSGWPPPRSGIFMILFVLEIVFMIGMFWSGLIPLILLCILPCYRSDTPGIQSIFLGPTYLQNWQQALVPERDWLWLAGLLGTRFDIRISKVERKQIREWLKSNLDEMRDDSNLNDTAPAWPLVFWGRILRPDHGHLFVYRPEVEPGEKLGLLIFLHGHGGNSLLLPHVLRDFAIQYRCVLVCPSFGYGNWEHLDSPNAVSRAMRYALEHFGEIDSQKVFLAGHSQGGAGVGRAAVAMPEAFAGLIFLSPTLEPKILNDEGVKGQRALVIHGDSDLHVKLKSVQKGIEAMQTAGADVTVNRDPNGTHFLLFAQSDEVFRMMGEWMNGREVLG